MDDQTSAQMNHSPMFAKELSDICARLEREIPPGPYMDEAFVAATLKISPKTLANSRSAKRGGQPPSGKLGRGRKRLYPREALINWLAKEELASMHTFTHRCL